MGIKDVNFRSYDYKFYTLISSRYGFNEENFLTAETCIKYEKVKTLSPTRLNVKKKRI